MDASRPAQQEFLAEAGSQASSKGAVLMPGQPGEVLIDMEAGNVILTIVDGTHQMTITLPPAQARGIAQSLMRAANDADAERN